MSETPEELRALIDGARKAGPGPERLASVRARLETQLGPLDAPRAAPAGLGSTATAIGVVAVLALVGLGAWIGTRSPFVDAPSVDAPSVDSTSIEPTSTPSVAPPSSEPAPEPASEHPAAPEPEPTLAAPAVPSTTTPDEGAAVRTEEVPVATRRVTPAVPAPTDPPPGTDAASSLREEIALLDRALRASEAGDPVRARAALEEHRARFPSGTLSPERERMLTELPREPTEAPAPP